MLQDITGRNFAYTKLTSEEMAKRRILGRLVGPIADYEDPTRNEHFYSEALWDKVFEDPIVNEKIDNHSMFGELNHPFDGRSEIDLTQVAICLAEKPKKRDGKLWGIFDILDTPNGQILKALCDYGCNIGVSSRGEGDVINGNEIDPDTYDCECWDAVLLPAVKEARQTLVTESMNKKVSLHEALNKLTKSKDEKESKIMRDTIKSLKEQIDTYSYSQRTDNAVNIKHGTQSTVNNRDELSRTLNENQKLKKEIAALKEQLSTCNAREKEQSNALSKYREKVNSSKAINEQLLSEKNNNSKLSSDIQKLTERLDKIMSSKTKLAEEYNHLLQVKDKLSEQVNKLEEEMAKCKEMIALEKEKYSNELKSLLSEQAAKIEEIKSESAIQNRRVTEKLKKANDLTENYRKIAKVAVDNYIQSKAQMLGINTKDITSKLPTNYSFDDINKICESLKQYQTSVSKLPFDVKSAKMTAKTVVNEAIGPASHNEDDDVDDTLLSLANII